MSDIVASNHAIVANNLHPRGPVLDKPAILHQKTVARPHGRIDVSEGSGERDAVIESSDGAVAHSDVGVAVRLNAPGERPVALRSPIERGAVQVENDVIR